MNIWTVFNHPANDKKLLPCILIDGRWPFFSLLWVISIFEPRLPQGLFPQCCLELLNLPWLIFAVHMPHRISMLSKWNLPPWSKHSTGSRARPQIKESANIIYYIFASCNVLRQGEWYISCDLCRNNLNFQNVRKHLVNRGRLDPRFINKCIWR